MTASPADMRWAAKRYLILATASAFIAAGCSHDGSSISASDAAELDQSDDGATPSCPDIPCETLSAYGLFLGTGVTQEPAPGVVPYDVNVSLFADQSEKLRFVRLPENQTIKYRDDATWTFPIGTTLVKTFFYPHDARDPSLGRTLVETRLLIRQAGGWVAHTYVWNEEQTEAYRAPIGERVPVTWIDREGASHSLDYRVPNTNQCGRCHGDPVMNSLGPHTRQLNRTNVYGGTPINQLDHMAELGMFSGPIPPAEERAVFPLIDDDEAELDARARAYLDTHCSHCHDLEGAASYTGLWLDFRSYEPSALGVCRAPFSSGAGTGGRVWDIAPAAPDESIMIYRMESTDPDVRMPELPNQLVDHQGVALIRAWIAAMSPVDCSAQ